MDLFIKLYFKIKILKLERVDRGSNIENNRSSNEAWQVRQCKPTH